MPSPDLQLRARVDELAQQLALGRGFQLLVVVVGEGEGEREGEGLDAHLLADGLSREAGALRGALVEHLLIDPALLERPGQTLRLEQLAAFVVSPLVGPSILRACEEPLVVVDLRGASGHLWSRLLGFVNRQRNALTRAFAGSLVLLVSEAFELELARVAPDLWSIRSGVVRLSSLAGLGWELGPPRGRLATQQRLRRGARGPADADRLAAIEEDLRGPASDEGEATATELATEDGKLAAVMLSAIEPAALVELASGLGWELRPGADRRAVEELVGHARRSGGLGQLLRALVERRPELREELDADWRIEVEAYLQKAAALHEYAPLLGFNIKARLSLRLEELYVPLDADFGQAERGGASEQAQVPLAEAFARARERGRRGVILLGDLGSGKTTQLEQVLLKVARDGPESIGLPAGTVPVFLPLQLLQVRDEGFEKFIDAQLGDPLLGAAPDFGPRLRERGELLLLLDGLDEVADAATRALVARWIEAWQARTPSSHVLVSSRPAGYTADARFGEEVLELELRPFDDKQMRAFVHNWCGLVEGAMTSDPEQARIQARRRAEDLLTTLESREITAVSRVYEMTRNPLLLTAICLVHYDSGKLPRARALLYDESVGVLLERWRRRQGAGGGLTPAEARTILRPIAAWMHGERGRRRASGAELLEPVAGALARVRGAKMEAREFLSTIRDESGLLTGWGVDDFGFMHLGFQEFLTAKHLRNEGLKRASVFAELAERFDDSWWQEVILLMLAQRDPSAFEGFMGALIERPEFADWAGSGMMQLCLVEAAEPTASAFLKLLREPDPRGLVRRLFGREAGRERARRQLAAAKVLARSMPEALAAIDEELAGHPVEEVREWWAYAGGVVRAGGAGKNRGGVELVEIPGGRFMMGSPPDERGRGRNEGPLHEVELDSFYLAATPVTNAQYAKYLAAKPDADEPRHWADRRYNQPDQPVVGVSWHEAMAYCEWAGLVLPTEAQWEYACRAGTQTRYWSGDSEDDLARVGWYDGNSAGRLHPVAEKEPNAFGLYDVHGNVWEWCLDRSGSYTTSPRSKDGLRHEPVGGGRRVMRGGGWYSPAVVARAAYRNGYDPGYRVAGLGFRPAQGIP